MSHEYGYGVLEDQLIDLFCCSGSPHFEAAEALIARGADLNAVSPQTSDENVLSEILQGYWYTEDPVDFSPEEIDLDADAALAAQRERRGEAMIQIIQFFLDHGFDVHKNNGKFGAQCLYAIVLSTFSPQMLTAAKLLFDAGARNLPIDDSEPDETPWNFVGTECSFQGTCEHDHHLENLYEAFYQMFQALEDGLPYSGIDSYTSAIGRRVIGILAEKPLSENVFYPLSLAGSNHKNCFRQPLYFLFDGGYLTIDQYACSWVNTELPKKELEDISLHFPGVVGSTIVDFSFDHNTVVKGSVQYGQPIVSVVFDSGVAATFSLNFGEVEDRDRAAYYSLQQHKR